MKRIAISVLATAFAFSLLATWLGPRVIVWYFTPPAGMAMTFNAGQAVQWGMDRLIEAQLTGAVVGALIALVVSFILVRRKSRLALPAAATAAAPTAQAPTAGR